jgi:hypothetical protein
MLRDSIKLKNKFVLVLGGGKFGKIALKYLKVKGCKLLLVDHNPQCTAKSEVSIQAKGLNVVGSLSDGQAAFLVDDAAKVLLDILKIKVPDLVVTAIPGNAVAKVVMGWLSIHGCKLEPFRKIVPKVLENIPKSLVSFFDPDSGVIVISYMPSSLLCRENCMPPKDFCASTGRPKPVPMDKLLEFSVYNLIDKTIILTSKQLTGGLGAIDGHELWFLLKGLEKVEKPYTLAVGTACDCHGIINLAKIMLEH